MDPTIPWTFQYTCPFSKPISIPYRSQGLRYISDLRSHLLRKHNLPEFCSTCKLAFPRGRSESQDQHEPPRCNQPATRGASSDAPNRLSSSWWRFQKRDSQPPDDQRELSGSSTEQPFENPFDPTYQHLLENPFKQLLEQFLDNAQSLLECLLELTYFIRLSRLWSEFPRSKRHLCTTMPWTIWPSLVVLWGVCWMFIVYPAEDGSIDPSLLNLSASEPGLGFAPPSLTQLGKSSTTTYPQPSFLTRLLTCSRL